jgi:hypothetical protein
VRPNTNSSGWKDILIYSQILLSVLLRDKDGPKLAAPPTAWLHVHPHASSETLASQFHSNLAHALWERTSDQQHDVRSTSRLCRSTKGDGYLSDGGDLSRAPCKQLLIAMDKTSPAEISPRVTLQRTARIAMDLTALCYVASSVWFKFATTFFFLREVRNNSVGCLDGG